MIVLMHAVLNFISYLYQK